MRVKNAEARGKTDERQFADFLLAIGNGQVETVPLAGEDQMIKIPEAMKSKSTDLKDFFHEIYPNLRDRHHEGMAKLMVDDKHETWLMKRAIICATNEQCEKINQIGVQELPGKPMVYHSSDRVINSAEAFNYPTEFLWKINCSSMPPHTLVLKKGTPIMLLRNLDAPNGHVNGARYIILNMTPKIIYARLATPGVHKGKTIMIPRILFHPKDRTIPFEMERQQFPIKTCLSITGNKSQGQTLESVGINLTQDFFSHGQLYVALSRVGSQSHVKIFKPKDDPTPDLTRNVVFQAVL